jgi:hypothetical protein
MGEAVTTKATIADKDIIAEAFCNSESISVHLARSAGMAVPRLFAEGLKTVPVERVLFNFYAV